MSGLVSGCAGAPGICKSRVNPSWPTTAGYLRSLGRSSETDNGPPLAGPALARSARQCRRHCLRRRYDFHVIYATVDGLAGSTRRASSRACSHVRQGLPACRPGLQCLPQHHRQSRPDLSASISRRGDLQHSADRPDFKRVAVFVDKVPQALSRLSSSAWAKKMRWPASESQWPGAIP